MRMMLPGPPPIALLGLLVGLTTTSSSATTASEIEAARHYIVVCDDCWRGGRHVYVGGNIVVCDGWYARRVCRHEIFFLLKMGAVVYFFVNLRINQYQFYDQLKIIHQHDGGSVVYSLSNIL